jgi:hypothetical protein
MSDGDAVTSSATASLPATCDRPHTSRPQDRQESNPEDDQISGFRHAQDIILFIYGIRKRRTDLARSVSMVVRELARLMRRIEIHIIGGAVKTDTVLMHPC